MKYIVQQEELLTALGAVTRIVNPRHVIEVLRYAILSAGSEQTSIQGTDEVNFVTANLPGVADVPFQAAVPVDALTKLVSNLDGGEMTLTYKVENGTLTVVQGRSRHELKCDTRIDRFPIEPTVSDAVTSVSGLKRAIDKASYAMSPKPDDIPAVSCLHLIPVPSGTVVATADRNRVVVLNGVVPEVPRHLAIPGRMLPLISSIIGDGDADVAAKDGSICITNPRTNIRITFQTPGDEDAAIAANIYAKQTESQRFFDDTPFTATVDRSVFQKALKRMAIHDEANSAGGNLVVTIGDGALSLGSHYNTNRQGDETIPAETTEYPSPFVFNVALSYLAQAVAILSGADKIRLSTKSVTPAAAIRLFDANVPSECHSMMVMGRPQEKEKDK